ncbi:MAG: hypothetical protein JNL28_11160 [Planctomycetes bacterium]|nr:hypothetical protein [Planctomycetota bacterium]
MTTQLDRSISSVRAAVARAVFGSTCLAWAAGILFATACAVLLARTAFEWGPTRAAWLYLPLVVAPLVAWRSSVRKRLSPSGAAAWLDVQTGAGGLVVTGFELDDGAWRARLDEALAHVRHLPAARMRRPGMFCALAVAFAVAALFVPIPRAVVGPGRALQQAALEKVEEKLATLEEEVELAPEFASEMRASLERLREDDALAASESALEAADRANERLLQEAEARAEAAEQALDGLAAAGDEAGGDPEAAQKQLEEALAQLTKAGFAKGLEDALTSELGLKGLELPPGTQLDAEQIAKLSDALAGKLGDKLAKLAARGLLKPGKFGREGRPGDLEDFVEHVCTEECKKNPGGT